MEILNNEEQYEAFLELVESRIGRQLNIEERDRMRSLASSGPDNFHVLTNIFGELGSHREDN